MKKKCILFDLDGTIVSTGGAGNRALENAFAVLYQIPNAMRTVDPAGKTDPAIIREIFHYWLGRDCSAKEMQEVQTQYLEFLPQECQTAVQYQMIPGIRQLLDQLKAENAVMGLGTGNLEQGARIKLTRANLNSYFPFGGYGSDSENRAELLKIAKQKAEQYSGVYFRSQDVFVVGDTERDIMAARQADFKVISVSAGGVPAELLEKYNPDFLIADFTNFQDFMKMVYGPIVT